MRFEAIQRIVGALLLLSGLSMLPPAVVSVFYGDASWLAFLEAAGILRSVSLDPPVESAADECVYRSRRKRRW